MCVTSQLDFRVRDAVPAETAAIEALARRAFRTAAPEWAGHADDEAPWARWVSRFFEAPLDGQFILVAEGVDRAIWGVAHVLQMIDPLAPGGHPHLETAAVAEFAEGRGVASALIEASAQRARELGGELFTLHVYPGNSRAQAVYERLGFDAEWLRMRRPLA
ncbi:hypothetical protein BH24ACT9_BH24ACT9_04810 [soil metagenome]